MNKKNRKIGARSARIVRDGSQGYLVKACPKSNDENENEKSRDDEKEAKSEREEFLANRTLIAANLSDASELGDEKS